MVHACSDTPLGADRITALGDTVAVFAHPDDETYLCGGTMAALRDAGCRVVCITATRGELGGQAAPDELRALRTAELRRALDVLRVDEHVWLDLPDGGLAGLDPAGPVRRLTRLLRLIRPRTVLTFAPDGLTGHPDHIAVGQWARAAFAEAATPGSRLLETATTHAHRARFAHVEAELGVLVGEAPRPTHEALLAVHAEFTGAALARKVEALIAQASQTDVLRAALGDDVFRSWVATEAFRAA